METTTLERQVSDFMNQERGESGERSMVSRWSAKTFNTSDYINQNHPKKYIKNPSGRVLNAWKSNLVSDHPELPSFKLHPSKSYVEYDIFSQNLEHPDDQSDPDLDPHLHRTKTAKVGFAEKILAQPDKVLQKENQILK